MPFVDQLQEFAFAHYRVGKIQAGELDLLRMTGDGSVFAGPVIQWAVVCKLQGTE